MYRLKKMKGKEHLNSKLSMRYYGPFQMIDKIEVFDQLKLAVMGGFTMHLV